ncbi:hypothetical protein NON20_02575 [Synechocystis sp. B12]|jgi:hypothetical protein|nr:hypothetical protein [Synechocystis sp. CACIAM 05]WLT38708.1 hypothetical protein NON20_02575 [Synechocystis sp. B12]
MEGNFYRDLLAMLLFVTNFPSAIGTSYQQKSLVGPWPSPEQQ